MMVPSTSNRAALIFKDKGFVVKGIAMVCIFAFVVLIYFKTLKRFITRKLGKKKMAIKRYLRKIYIHYQLNENEQDDNMNKKERK